MHDQRQHILATLEDYAQAYCNKDLDALMRVFDDDDRVSAIGTGADELCVGPEAIRQLFERNFNEATASKFEWTWRHVQQHENQATVSATLNIHICIDDKMQVVPIRWTIVMIKHERWLWLHRHASAAASGQEEGKAYPNSN